MLGIQTSTLATFFWSSASLVFKIWQENVLVTVLSSKLHAGTNFLTNYKKSLQYLLPINAADTWQWNSAKHVNFRLVTEVKFLKAENIRSFCINSTCFLFFWKTAVLRLQFLNLDRASDGVRKLSSHCGSIFCADNNFNFWETEVVLFLFKEMEDSLIVWEGFKMILRSISLVMSGPD